MLDEDGVNPLLYDRLGEVASYPGFPDDVTVDGYCATYAVLPSDDIVNLIVSDPKFQALIPLLRSSIEGMDTKTVGKVLITKFIDLHFPSVLQRINSSDDEFALFRDVIYKLVEAIRVD